MKRRIGIAISIAIAAGLALWAVMNIQQTQSTQNFVVGRPAPIIWLDQDEQATAKTDDGEFSVRAFLVTPDKYLFFYSLTTAQKESPTVSAVALNTQSTNKVATQLQVSKVQEVAQFAETRVGVIEVEQKVQPGDSLTLEVGLASKSSALWKITPLKQIASSASVKGTYFHANRQKDGVIVLPGVIGGKDSLATLELKGENNQALYLLVSSDGATSKISQDEFKTRNAPMPVTPPPSSDLRATPAPIRP